MARHIAFVQHSPVELPGVLGTRAAGLGFEVRTFRADRGRAGLPALQELAGVVVMGSVESVNDHRLAWVGPERELIKAAVGRAVPVLGVCFGGQLLAQVLGGTVGPSPEPETGWSTVETADPSTVPSGPWLLWHKESFTLPTGATLVARSRVARQAFVKGPHMGVQFHPEATPEIVDRWVAEAHGRGDVTPAERRALVGDIDRQAAASAVAAATLFDGFLRRAGLLVSAG